MNYYPFNVRLDSNIRVQNTENGYTISPNVPSSGNAIVLAKNPGMEMAFALLQAGNTTTDSLIQELTDLDGEAVGEQFSFFKQEIPLPTP